MSTSKLSSTCRLAPGVYLARQDDITRVLDLDRGRFYGLDATASRLLLRTLECGPDAAAAEVAHACGVEAALVRGDLETLIADLVNREILQSEDPGRRTVRCWLPRWLAGPCRVRGPVTVRLAARLLRRAWWSLRMDGWASSLERWRSPVGSTTPTDLEQAEALIGVVDRAIRDAAAGLWLFPVACKERALVGRHLLRAVFGLPADLVLGVQHYPFGVHAWVEVGGRTVTDDPEHCANFEPVARFE